MTHIPFQSDKPCEWARELLSDADIAPHMYVSRILKHQDQLRDEQRHKPVNSSLPKLPYYITTGEIDPHFLYQQTIEDLLPLANVLCDRMTPVQRISRRSISDSLAPKGLNARDAHIIQEHFRDFGASLDGIELAAYWAIQLLPYTDMHTHTALSEHRHTARKGVAEDIEALLELHHQHGSATTRIAQSAPKLMQR